MGLEQLHRLTMFVSLCLVQVLILNHIHLFDIATPLLYVYFAVTFRRNFPRWMVLLWCFGLGLLVDVFTSTPGLAAGSLTLVGFVQTYLVELVVPRDSADNLDVSAATLGWGRFAAFSAILVLLYCLVFFALEAFSLFNWLLWLERVCGSAILTLILMMGIESVRSR